MKIINFFILTVLILLVTSCFDSKQKGVRIDGKTMGTYYSINIVDLPKNISRQDLQFEITKTLDEVNKKLSNWDSFSEVSLLNQKKTTLPINISKDLFNIIYAANEIHLK